GLGQIYRQRKVEIELYDSYTNALKQKFILDRIRPLVVHAYQNISFYRNHYDSHGFKPEHLKTFDDIARIPLVEKAILREFDLEERSAPQKGRYVVNTGGSSGTPFSFYIEPSSMGHEWAHMHHIWEELNYRPSDLKLLFGGRSDLKEVVEYDVLRNHFAIDIYAEYELVAKKLKQLLRRYKIKYLHGYPSSIYDFAVFCQEHDDELKHLLSQNLRGIFYGSEYPHGHY